MGPALVPDVPFEITAIRLRRSSVGPDASTEVTTKNLEVWIGTAPTTTQTGEFADNLTGDEVRIFNGALTVPANGPDLLAFDDFVITLATPFAYDPSVGPLIFDFRAPDNSVGANFDCVNDGSMYMYLSTAAGTPTSGNTSTGCGYAMQIDVQ